MPTCSREVGEVKDISDNTQVSILFFDQELFNSGLKPKSTTPFATRPTQDETKMMATLDNKEDTSDNEEDTSDSEEDTTDIEEDTTDSEEDTTDSNSSNDGDDSSTSSDSFSVEVVFKYTQFSPRLEGSTK